ncbi:MAG: ATP-binding protein [Candidatus Magnetomorum sp.]|nr:ATP-binding protein [Candidatus Magnetomorum sp.]
MEDLLKRARSGGLGIILATQSPGDLDYKCKENILSWFLGRIKEPTALAKLKPMFSNSSMDIGKQLSALTTGQFYIVKKGTPQKIKGYLNTIPLIQLSESEILTIAKN